jgi:hypothetical protein
MISNFDPVFFLTIIFLLQIRSRRQTALSKVRKHPSINTLAIKYNPRMSAASNQAAMERFERARDLLLKENKQAYDSISKDNFSKMEKIFKSGGIKQQAIDWLIFYVMSVKMMKMFLRYGGDMHKLGPPLYPNPRTLLFRCTASLRNYIEKRELVKLIKFLIEEGADVNAVDLC